MTSGSVFESVSSYRTATDGSLFNAASAGASLTETVSSPAGTPLKVSPFDGDDTSMDWQNVTSSYTVTSGQNRIVLIPVIIEQDRIHDVIRFAAATAPAGTTSAYVYLWKIDRATGTITKVFDSGECKTNYNGAWRTGIVVSVPVPQFDVQQGEAYYVGVHQVGAGPYGAIYGGPASVVARTVNVQYPYDVGSESVPQSTNGATSMTPASYNAGAGLQMLWAALGITTVPISPLSLSEPYTQPNGPLSSLWVPRVTGGGAGLRVLSNGLAASAYNDTNDYLYSHVMQMRRDDHKVKITYPQTGGNPPDKVYLALRCSDTNQCFAVWDVTAGTCAIKTSTGWTVTGTSQQSGSAPTIFRDLSFEAVGDTYTLTCNETSDNVVISWTDTAAAVHPVGLTQRIVGKGLKQTVVGALNTRPFADNWSAQDL